MMLPTTDGDGGGGHGGAGAGLVKYMVTVMTMMWAKLGEWSLNCLIDSSPLNSHCQCPM